MRERLEGLHVESALGGLHGALDHLDEAFGFVDVEVHRGEPDVGDGVESAQGFKHKFAQAARADFALARQNERALDAVDGLLHALRRNGTLSKRKRHRGVELVAVVFDARAPLLDDVGHLKGRPLEGREAFAALDALPTTSNDGALLGRAGVNDLGVLVLAKGATHGARNLQECVWKGV